MKLTFHSEVGDKVTVKHPRTGKREEGTVSWVSPTRGTMQVTLSDGVHAYEFPEDDGKVRPITAKAAAWYAANGKGGFKGAVNKMMTEMEVGCDAAEG